MHFSRVQRLQLSFPCLLWLLSPLGSPAANDPPAGYYASAEGKSGAALEAALHDIIDDHTVVSYSWPPFLDIDESASNSSHVDLIYSDGSRSKTLNGGSVGDWNREHLWPRSFGIFNDGGADNSDLFNLRPSDVQVNSERGSLFFEDTDPVDEIPLQFNAPGCSKDSDSWEPRDDEKGDIARACFYMDVRYDGSDPITNDLELSDAPNKPTSEFGSLLTLLRWHRLDPVTEAERERNHAIYSNWQGNRNPFIDRPEFAEQLFLSKYPTLDTDNDGLPDWYEYRTMGGLSANASDDIDEDGSDTLLEFALATDPSDPSQHPELSLTAGEDFTLSFFSSTEALAAGYTIAIQASEDLSPGSWQDATILDTETSPAGAGVEQTIATLGPPGVAARRFYRVLVDQS